MTLNSKTGRRLRGRYFILLFGLLVFSELQTLVGTPTALNWGLAILHSNVGWLLYTVGIALYMALVEAVFFANPSLPEESIG